MIIMVLRGEDANLLSVGAIDFGIIVDSAVILVENIFRQLPGKRGRKKTASRKTLPKGRFGTIQPVAMIWTKARLDRSAAPDLHQRQCKWIEPYTFQP